MKTQSERLYVLEEKVDSGFRDTNTRIEAYSLESRRFHAELLEKLDKLAEERVQIATLKEKVRSLEKITWTALSVAVGAVIKLIVDSVSI